ncbi:MAG: glycolate oxidase subunit GlcE [Thiolinea sp.]
MPDLSRQLLEQVNNALSDNTALSIQGNKTKSALGRSPQQEMTELAVSGHSGIVKYEPGELVMTARAGTPLAEIDEALSGQGQILACDPHRYAGQATLGGSLATHQSGPGRPWLGSLRDHVLGVRLINGKGEHLRFGGQVMKNVAGYDVSRLQAGAMGTLGVITEVSFKVLPKPDYSLTLSKQTGLVAGHQLMKQLGGSTKPLTGMAWVDDCLYLRLQGSRQAVEATARQWQAEYQTETADPEQGELFWLQLREHELDFHQQSEAGDGDKLWRYSVNPRTGPFMTGERWLFNWGGAQRWLRGGFDLEALTEHAEASGGEVCLYEGGDAEEERMLMNNPALRRIQQNLKASLDPQGIFNPGKLFSWL